MVLPIQYNPISLGNVQVEYGGTNPIGLNEYYGQGNAPASGSISLGDFHQTSGSGTAAVTTNLLFELDARNSSSWPGSGTTWYDTTSNARNFSLINGPIGGTNSVVFDGTDDYAQIANGTWIPSGTSARTVEFYVKMHTWRTTNQVAFLYSKTSPSNQAGNFGFQESSGNVYLGMSTQGGGTFSNNITSQYQLSNPSNYLNSWHQYAFTYDGSIVKIYVDGSLVWTSSANQNLHSNTAPQRMMSFDPTNGSYFWPVDGELGIVRMYNTALTATQISTNYSNCVSGAGPVTPTAATLSFTPSSHTGSTFTGTFSFDKNVGDFTTGDVTVTGGSKGTFTKISGSEYTLSLTPTTTSSTVSVSVPANSAYTAGNLGHNSISLSLAYAPFVLGNLVCRVDANNNTSYNGSGNTWTDLSTAGNNVTLNNSPLFVGGGAVEYFTFDGSNDYGQVTRMISTSFTLAAWIRTTSQDGQGGSGNFWSGYGIIDTEQGGSGDFGLVVKDGSGGFGTGNNTTIWSSPSTHPVTDGAWHYLVATRNASTGEIILYVDGSQAAQNSTSGGTNALTDTSTIRIGRTYSGARYYTGDIAEVHIYDDVLTSSEVSTNYSSAATTYLTPEIITSTGGSHSGSQFTFTFSWSIPVTGFTASDITVTNATKGTFSGSGKNYSLVLTPSGTNNISVSIPAGACSGVTGSVSSSAFSTTLTYSSGGTFDYNLSSTTLSNSDTENMWFNVWYRRQRVQVIFTASELSAQSVPTNASFENLKFNVAGAVNSSYSNRGVNIKIFHTTTNPTTSAFATETTTPVTVYADTSTTAFTLVNSTGIKTVTFGGGNAGTAASSFTWNGTNNICIEVCTSQNASSYNRSGQLYYTSGSGMYGKRDDSSGNACTSTPSSTGTLSGRPNISMDWV